MKTTVSGKMCYILSVDTVIVWTVRIVGQITIYSGSDYKVRRL